MLDAIDGAVGCATVDLTTGLMLGIAHSVPHFNESYLDAVAASAVDMFRGKTISQVEQLLSSSRGTVIENTIKEIQMTTDHTYHFMSVIPDKPDTLVILITTKTTSLGMGWASIKSNLSKISELCPS